MSKTQRGVAAGMFAALAVTLAITFWCVQDSPGLVLPFHMVGVSQRWTVAAACWLGPLVAMAVAIGAVANRRFFSPEDIDGAGLTPEGPRVRVPRAILANTLEQSVLAIPVYTALALFLPARQLPLPALLSAAFVIGRITFAAGYARGAAARSFGFALTFYPTAAGLLVVVLVLARRIAG